MKNSKQQKPINSFFKKKDKDEKQERTPSISKKIAKKAAAADKENTNAITLDLDLPPLSSFAMGCKSQDRKGSIQKAKERTYSIQNALREAKKNRQQIKPKNPQRKLDGTITEPRCDDPDNPKECNACTKKAQYEARGKTFKGFAHDYSCPHYKDYLDNLFGEQFESAKKFDREAKLIAKKNNEPLPGVDLHVRKEDGIKFFSPRQRNSANASVPPPPDADAVIEISVTAPVPAFDPFDVTYMTKKFFLHRGELQVLMSYETESTSIAPTLDFFKHLMEEYVSSNDDFFNALKQNPESSMLTVVVR